MKVIYKYIVPVEGLLVPLGDVLAVSFQGDSACPVVWVDHDIDEKRVQRLQFVPTGIPHSFAELGYNHVGSAISNELCWHVYSDRKA